MRALIGAGFGAFISVVLVSPGVLPVSHYSDPLSVPTVMTAPYADDAVEQRDHNTGLTGASYARAFADARTGTVVVNAVADGGSELPVNLLYGSGGGVASATGVIRSLPFNSVTGCIEVHVHLRGEFEFQGRSVMGRAHGNATVAVAVHGEDRTMDTGSRQFMSGTASGLVFAEGRTKEKRTHREVFEVDFAASPDESLAIDVRIEGYASNGGYFGNAETSIETDLEKVVVYDVKCPPRLAPSPWPTTN